MIPVYQTRFGERKNNDEKGGNCFQAALASLFELELDNVPDFCNLYPLETDEWYYKYREWLNGRGYSVLSFTLFDGFNLNDPGLKGCYLLTTGPNHNGVSHCMIYKDGKPAHNPNGSCRGITPKTVDIIFPLDIARIKNDPTKNGHLLSL